MKGIYVFTGEYILNKTWECRRVGHEREVVAQGNSTLRNVFKILLNPPKSDCIYHAPIDLEPNGCPFGSKRISLKYIYPLNCQLVQSIVN